MLNGGSTPSAEFSFLSSLCGRLEVSDLSTGKDGDYEYGCQAHIRITCELIWELNTEPKMGPSELEIHQDAYSQSYRVRLQHVLDGRQFRCCPELKCSELLI